ncbi:TonB-dependent receptor [Pelagicoccus sp. SDUM812005]|nr:TonB-dependent receptor [Pelagicoccus sp. SDUM812005]
MPFAFSVACLVVACELQAHDAVYLPGFEVTGQDTPLHGEAISASQGFAGGSDLSLSMADGAGGLLEAVPGMVATQHSGSGKANQYFLRGFNLDHGTDFSVSVDGMQVNTPSHGHGQGYADVNFLIPEMVSMVSYLKGPYYALVGDFASTGSASLQLRNVLEQDFAELALEEHGRQRVVAGMGRDWGKADTIFALELESNDGPWELDENLDKRNALFRLSGGSYDERYSVTAMSYDSSWDATDQIPERSVQAGELSDFGFVDPTVGGRTTRYSVSANWRRDVGHVRTFATAYAIHYDMNLWSNFTYFLEDPENGDQFEQADRRQSYGMTFGKTFYYQELFGKQMSQTVALQGRWDAIDRLGLYATKERERLATVREDVADVVSTALAYEAKIDWTPRFRSHLGLRIDGTDMSVRGEQAGNTGSATDWIASPKLNLVYTMNDSVEWYASAGDAFHSNDARGAAVGIDPLVRSHGREIGARYQLSGKVNTSIALWDLDLDSELLYVGDAGSTEASRPSERQGVDWTTFFALSEKVNADLDFAWSDAQFSDSSPDGNLIPGVVERKWGAGVSYQLTESLNLAARYRYFGGRPLVEDGSVYSEASDSVSLRLSREGESWDWTVQVSNLFDSRDPDISYYYESRLPGESLAGVADIHSHVMKPRTVQLRVKRKF